MCDSCRPRSGRLNVTRSSSQDLRQLRIRKDASFFSRLMALETESELIPCPDRPSMSRPHGVNSLGCFRTLIMLVDIGKWPESWPQELLVQASNMKFRNYLPHDKHLQEGKLEPVDLPKFEDPVASVQQPSEKTEDPFVNIAPKKPNWDLRRDVQKKLDKLERRTQKALYELMLEQEKEKAAMEVEKED
ncbi:hypothetical protein KSP39_PZI008685 [Platanthera zijinensis]|uniref:Coiled-coil domain-containing protein 12 n=1 Tax=Platanthera zijinensis TaxID=2320716 RepID=A0AAP0G8N6_9ASPA